MSELHEELSEPDTVQAAAAAAPGIGTLIVRLAGQIGELGPGERAMLRRMEPDNPSHDALAVVIRLLVQAGAADRELDPARALRWGLLIQALALLAGTAEKARPHRQGERPGSVWANLLTGGGAREPKESDARLLALLAASGDSFDVLLIRMMRRLAAAGVTAIDAVELWHLIDDPDANRHDPQRLRIARDFYRYKQAAGAAAAANP